MPLNLKEFFDSVNVIAQKNVEAARVDTTVTAEIVAIQNIEVGEYKI